MALQSILTGSFALTQSNNGMVLHQQDLILPPLLDDDRVRLLGTVGRRPMLWTRLRRPLGLLYPNGMTTTAHFLSNQLFSNGTSELI